MISSRLPEPFIERLCAILEPGLCNSVLSTFSEEKMTSFRLNKLNGGDIESIKRLTDLGLDLQLVEGLDNVWGVKSGQRDLLIGSAEFEKGEIYVQNISSMIPPVILAPTQDDRVLDLTAAPGSKTLQLAEMTGDMGQLLAVEKVRKRFYKLKDNLQKNGAGFVKTFMGDGEKVWKRNMETFDHVLLDAPCSTEGRFMETDPETYRYWSMRKIKEMVRKQSRLLFSAVQCLKPGGSLVYSTCTFAPEENEGVVDRIMQKFDGRLSIEEIDMPEGTNWTPGLTTWKSKRFNPQTERARRILPDHSYEGFFICKIKKTTTTIG